ncbi:MAG: 50S ribosomal protein L6 [Candidatus Helarchaeota archaeon]|nr:50S ribosomal protein L6 [Candidatus Helarchaeota archaeon]
MVSEIIITKAIEIPQGVQLTLDDKVVKVSGPKGEITKNFSHARAVKLSKDDNKIILTISSSRKKTRAIISTIKSHIENMIKGTTLGPYIVKMKIVYAHFPITVKVKEGKVFIENFLGERSPRVAKIYGENTKVEVEKDDVIIKSNNNEEAGQTAANIQKVTKIKDKDPRTFQDGIFKYQKFLGDKLIWKLKF